VIGIDIGMRIASVVSVKRDGFLRSSKVIKLGSEGTEWERVSEMARLLAHAVFKMKENPLLTVPKVPISVAIEEPIYSWARKNPRAYGKNMMLFALLRFRLDQKHMFRIFPVNPTTAKKKAGHGKMDKAGMIKAMLERLEKVGPSPVEGLEKTFLYPYKYGQETIADSYFIAMAAFDLIPKNITPNK